MTQPIGKTLIGRISIKRQITIPTAPANSNTRHIKTISGDGSDLHAKQPFLSPHEREGVHMQKQRIAKLIPKSARDWDGQAANDNAAWPLAKALLAENNGDLLKYAIAYRRIYDQAMSGAVLGGSAYTPQDGRVIDYVTQYDESSGTILAAKIRQSRSVDAVASAPARRRNVTNDATLSATSPIGRPWGGDKAVNDMIDAKPKLAQLRAALGAIVEPFEMIVVGGATLAEGGRAGFATERGVMSAGRAIVHMGLLAIRPVIGGLKYEDLEIKEIAA